MYLKMIKPALDFILSLLLLLPTLFLIAILGVLIKIEDGGPIFYNAKRIGKHGKLFTMYKLRSMIVNAPDIRNQDGTTFSSKNDPRLTRIGRVLRQTSLDEVPQILNVVKGDMSFVGPRPDLPDLLGAYGCFAEKRLSVRPGVTGYTQAYFRNSLNMNERNVKNDYYIDHASLWQDTKIILVTGLNILMRKPVYRNKANDTTKGASSV